MDRAALYDFIRRHRYGVISSIGENGAPQSALVGISVAPRLEIIFDTVKSSRKYAKLVRHPACSFVVGWPGEQTLQFEGEAELPTGDRLRDYQTIYFATWKDGAARLTWPGLVHFVVHPRWIRYSDYDQNPPLIEEFIRF